MDEAVEHKERSQRRCRVRATVRHTQAPMALHQNVLLQDRDSKLWSIRGQIMSIFPNGRSYVVRTENGTYLRGIRFIKPDKSESSERVLVVMSAPSSAASRPSCMKAPDRARRCSKRVTFNSTPQFVP